MADAIKAAHDAYKAVTDALSSVGPVWLGVWAMFLAAAATFLAVIAAIWGENIRRWWRAPRLELTFDPRPDHFQRIYHPGLVDLASYYIRVSVMNKGVMQAENVELRALGLDVDGGHGQFRRDPAFMAMNMKTTHYDATVTRVVHQGIPKPYDVLQCLNQTLQIAAHRKDLLIEFATEVPPAQVEGGVWPSWKSAGRYRLRLAVAADSASPVFQEVLVDWFGKWSDDEVAFFRDELTISLAKPHRKVLKPPPVA